MSKEKIILHHTGLIKNKRRIEMKEIMNMIAFLIGFIILVLILTLIIWTIEAFIILFFTFEFKWDFQGVLEALVIFIIVKNIFTIMIECSSRLGEILEKATE